MAVELVAGAFLSSFFDAVFDSLKSSQVVNWIRGKKLDQKLLERLKITLEAAYDLLDDAEQRQIKEKAVKDWLDSLEDAAYTADDLLEEVSTKAATQKDPGNPFSRLLNLQDREMVSRMEDITDTLESIVKQKDTLGLKEIPKENLSWRTTSSLVDISYIYGRDKDKEAITKLLLDNTNDGKISVIPIVGMGGIGKTTLAQLVYNDDKLKGKFDFKAWVCVGENFDVLKMTKTILEAKTSNSCKVNDLNSIQHELKNVLTGKRFLVVLDDMWDVTYDEWIKFQNPFQYGSEGSKIIVTTRNDNDASVVQTIQPYKLKLLSDDHCWLVFRKHASLFPGSQHYSSLEEVGKKIAEKCKGLPLAAQTLGGLLRTKHNVRDWNKILKSEIWKLSENESKILPALEISYHYLPSHLKRCFVFCSLYPKDYQFDRDELVLLWMAVDLLKLSGSGSNIEDFGYDCFNDLASRSFFQPSKSNENLFEMHDLMHDLAIFYAGKFYFRASEFGTTTDVDLKARHLSYDVPKNNLFSKFLETFDSLKHARTLLRTSFGRFEKFPEEIASSMPLLRTSFVMFEKFPEEIAEEIEIASSISLLRTSFGMFEKFPQEIASSIPLLLLQLKCLRVLCFKGIPLDSMPSSIGELIHLRYLDLSQTLIETLPESLGDLYNLQTLKLRDCEKLEMLPSKMQDLVNLRYFDLSETHIETLPESLSNLYNLQTLKLRGCKKLKMLPSRMQDLVNLRYFDLSRTLIETLPESLSNLYKLQTLKLIECKKLKMLPSRMQDLVNLRHLDIRGTDCLKEIPEGMNKLKDLQFLSDYIVGKHNVTRIREFGELTNLHGSLVIHKLENVSNSGEASDARMIDKEHIDDLEFIWSSSRDNVDLQTEKDIFDKLQPCTKVKKIRISGYMGEVFPDWLGQSSYHRMTELRLSGCRNCCELPSLGQLPDLKHLEISYFDKLTSIGAEFYKNDHGTPFPSLETLVLHRLPMWQVWHSPQFDAAFPQLKMLSIMGCPMLTGDLPNHLPALEGLHISGCEQLTCSLPSAPNILELVIYGVSEVRFQELASLRSLLIRRCSSAISFPGACMPASLQLLKIRDCKNLEFPMQQQRQQESLRTLEIDDSCDSLISFPLAAFPNLTELQIGRCANMKYFEGSQSKDAAPLPPSLELIIRSCPSFESLLSRCSRNNNAALPSLRTLRIEGCGSFASFSTLGKVAPLLERLSIYDCPEIEIDSFDEEGGDGSLPPTLRDLYIYRCEKLVRCLASSTVLHSCRSLTWLEIGGACDSVKSFPREGCLPASLALLRLEDIPSLETLDCKGLLHLTFLQHIVISNCTKLENIVGEGMPDSLQALWIDGSPLFGDRCRGRDPQIWPKIVHIPHISVDQRRISDTASSSDTEE